MSILDINDRGYAERETDLNWAAEYARRLVSDEVGARVEADEAEAAARAAAIEAEAASCAAAITAEAAEREEGDAAALAAAKAYTDAAAGGAVTAVDTNIKNQISGHGFSSLGNMAAAVKSNKSAIGTVSGLAQSALTEIPPASPGVLGGIKPLSQKISGANVNRSGLVISADGTTYVNVKSERGISRDGSGQLGINAASQDEVKAGAEAYKPVTPKTLKAEFDRRGSYSTKAQRIGTWIDGTPIWRNAFEIKFKDYFKADQDQYSSMLRSQDFDVPCAAFDGHMNVRVLAVQAVQVNDLSNPNVLDDWFLHHITEDGTCRFILHIQSLPKKYEDLENEGIYGYVEFITPESNMMGITQ